MAKENNRSSYFGDVVKKFLAHRLAMMGTIVLILEVLAVVFLPSIMKLDPYSMDYMAFGGAPSAEHLLGCDDVGRDLFARLIFGGRVSLMVGICSALISDLAFFQGSGRDNDNGCNAPGADLLDQL